MVACEGGDANRGIVDGSVLGSARTRGIPSQHRSRAYSGPKSALIEALANKRIAGAALDVFDGEPQVPPELMEMENVVLTPHIASSTHETRHAMADLVYDNLRAHFDGKPVLTPVPPQALMS